MESAKAVDEDLAFISGTVCFVIGVIQLFYCFFMFFTTILFGVFGAIGGLLSMIFAGPNKAAEPSSRVSIEFVVMKLIAASGGLFAVACFFVAIQFYRKKQMTRFGFAICIALCALNALLHLVNSLIGGAFVYCIVAIVLSGITYFNIRAENRQQV